MFLLLVFAFSNCCHHDDDDDDDFEDFREAPNFQFSTPHNQAPTTNHSPQTQFLLFLQFLLHLSLKTHQFVIQILSLGLHTTYFEPKPSLFGPLSFSKTHKHTKFFVSIYVEDTDDDDKEARNNDAGKFLLAVIIIGIS